MESVKKSKIGNNGIAISWLSSVPPFLLFDPVFAVLIAETRVSNGFTTKDEEPVDGAFLRSHSRTIAMIGW
ncbi:MAG: hypothetical protein H0X38_07765 [Planctomycetes bacterium]|nr:hypothetical protein [Planctomycetota bacterium]